MSRINTGSKKNFFASFFKKVNPFTSKGNVAKKVKEELAGAEPETKGSGKTKHSMASSKNRKYVYHRKMRNKMERKSRRYNLIHA